MDRFEGGEQRTEPRITRPHSMSFAQLQIVAMPAHNTGLAKCTRRGGA